VSTGINFLEKKTTLLDRFQKLLILLAVGLNSFGQRMLNIVILYYFDFDSEA
jgi:hypothetical protein